ncbi:unnamed protein product [Pseudo-nitzschia multistriata]|uniref:Uncharacterized protein n=1 Tax=Pseudo-nitzschia multistriata TaxID=183589 RepID=A0A448ZAL4_9STRA|nr:unnamed protein product [Pseudo-nitzschia multistriata]
MSAVLTGMGAIAKNTDSTTRALRIWREDGIFSFTRVESHNIKRESDRSVLPPKSFNANCFLSITHNLLATERHLDDIIFFRDPTKAKWRSRYRQSSNRS